MSNKYIEEAEKAYIKAKDMYDEANKALTEAAYIALAAYAVEATNPEAYGSHIEASSKASKAYIKASDDSTYAASRVSIAKENYRKAINAIKK